MKRLLTIGFALTVLVNPAPAVEIEWVTVGDPGNVGNDVADGLGAVSYVYGISKCEITNTRKKIDKPEPLISRLILSRQAHIRLLLKLLMDSRLIPGWLQLMLPIPIVTRFWQLLDLKLLMRVSY